MDAVANFAASLIATPPSPANTGTTATVTPGTASRFPAAPFDATLVPVGTTPDAYATSAEIVRVTNVNVGTDTLTFTRAVEGSTARAVASGWLIMAGPTAQTYTDLSALAFGVGRVNSGAWFTGAWTIPGGNGALVVNTLYAMPFLVGPSTAFDRIGCVATASVASSVVRLGVYLDAGGKPGALDADFGTVNTSGFGTKTLTIAKTYSGLVWVAAVAQGAAAQTTRLGMLSVPFIGNTDDLYASGATAVAYSLTGVSGALPGSWGALTRVNAANVAPYVHLRAA